MPAAKVTDLDARLKAHREKVAAERKYIRIKLFDREWRISNQINAFMAIQAGEGDVAALVEFLMNAAHPDERQDFHRELMRADVLDAEGLLLVINELMEVIAGHPTKSPSGSSRSRKTQAATRKSAAT